MLTDFIKRICEVNHPDLTVLKTKGDQTAALQLIPDLSDGTTATGTVGKQSMTSCKLHGFHKLGPKDDIECYLTTFVRGCLGQSFPQSPQTLELETYLMGRAQQAFCMLSET